MTHTVATIRVANQEYKIKCETAQVETLEMAAHCLSEKITALQASQPLSIHSAMLLAALNLCGEQLQQQAQNAFSAEQKETLNQLNQKVISALAY